LFNEVKTQKSQNFHPNEGEPRLSKKMPKTSVPAGSVPQTSTDANSDSERGRGRIGATLRGV